MYTYINTYINVYVHIYKYKNIYIYAYIYMLICIYTWIPGCRQNHMTNLNSIGIPLPCCLFLCPNGYFYDRTAISMSERFVDIF